MTIFAYMNVLLIGSGGREHALAKSLAGSPSITKLFIAPGNPGTAQFGENVPLNLSDFPSVEKFCSEKKMDLIVVGPEKFLAEGLSGYLRDFGFAVCGPGPAGAELESSKAFAKAFMVRHGIPTAKYKSFTSGEEKEAMKYIESLSLPVVVKASGLAAGKGVLICESHENAKRIAHEMLSGFVFGDAGRTVVIEEFLSGRELSVFILTDGKDYILLPEAKDYKRAGEGDKGFNTGGMGAISPVPFADAAFMKKVTEKVIHPTLKGMRDEAIEYRGFLFFGLINVGGEPFVIEYNCRMGDPETQVVLPRLEGDFLKVLHGFASGKVLVKFSAVKKEHCATVVMVSGGYPGEYEKGKRITGLEKIPGDVTVFHAGTKLCGSELYTDGGRVLAVTALGDSLNHALNKIYSATGSIEFEGKYFRKDIGTDMM